MRFLLVVAVMLVLYSSPAFAAEDWFPIMVLNEEVMVVGSGSNKEDCAKQKLNIENKSPKALVQCSRMQQRVHGENKDGTLDQSYLVSWLLDAVLFAPREWTYCVNELAFLKANGKGKNAFCARSVQIIK